MDNRLFDDLCKMIEEEIKAIVDKDDISPTDLDQLDKWVDIKKDIIETKNMEESGEMMPQGMSGRSYGIMPYYGYIGYDEPYGRSGAIRGRSNVNGASNNSTSSYGNYAQSRSGRMNYNDGSSYGYDDMRMMPDGRWN